MQQYNKQTRKSIDEVQEKLKKILKKFGTISLMLGERPDGNLTFVISNIGNDLSVIGKDLNSVLFEAEEKTKPQIISMVN